MKKLLLILTALFAVSPLFADIAPTPQIIYNFNYLNGTNLTIDPDNSEQIQCADNQCLSAEPLGKYGIQKLYCNSDSCFAFAYAFKPYQKLVIKFSDGKKRETPIFKAPTNLRNAIQINVKDDSMEAIALPQKPAEDGFSRYYMLVSLSVTLALEIVAGIIYLISAGLPLTVLLYLVAANLISIPFTWWILSDIVSNTAVLWTANFLFDLLFVYILGKRKISFRDALGLVFMANVTSYAFGIIITFMLASF